MSKKTTAAVMPTIQSLMFNKPLVSGFWPGCLAPTMHQVPCLRDGVATTFNCADLSGKFVLLLFQPVDFGYIGPTELELLDNLSLDCEVVAVTSGSVVGKQAFLNTPRSEGGGEGLSLTLVEDRNDHIAKAYGVMKEGSSYSFRAMFLIDPEGVVLSRQVGDLPSGLGAREAVRLLKASTGEVSLESMEQEMGGVQLEEFDQMAVGTMDEADDVGEGESPMEGYEGYVPYDKKSVKMESKDKTVESKKVNMSKTKSGLVSNTAPVFDTKNVVEETKAVEEEEELMVAVVPRSKKKAPSICSCDLDFYHSRNLHAHTTLERQEKEKE